VIQIAKVNFMGKEKIKIFFTDFWPNFVLNDNYFYHLLSQKYEVTISENNPDLLFFSVDYANKKNHLKYSNTSTKKIFYTGENINPDLNKCDASLSFNPTSADNFRLPLWVLFINWFDVPYSKNRDQSYLLDIQKLTTTNKYAKPNKPFCSFVASKPEGKRMEFFNKLNVYEDVSSAGRLFNNTKSIKGRGDQKWKINYLKKFKFNLALENSSSPGYVTEKILHSMYANSIPIYWGAADVGLDFNEKSFININNYKNDEEAVIDILDIHSNKERYLDILSQPWFENNTIPLRFHPKKVLEFIESQLNS
jgi:alpha(1,3/1,4) fucosyltransferase